jgi:hypothetical protein
VIGGISDYLAEAFEAHVARMAERLAGIMGFVR